MFRDLQRLGTVVKDLRASEATSSAALRTSLNQAILHVSQSWSPRAAIRLPLVGFPLFVRHEPANSAFSALDNVPVRDSGSFCSLV